MEYRTLFMLSGILHLGELIMIITLFREIETMKKVIMHVALSKYSVEKITIKKESDGE